MISNIQINKIQINELQEKYDNHYVTIKNLLQLFNEDNLMNSYNEEKKIIELLKERKQLMEIEIDNHTQNIINIKDIKTNYTNEKKQIVLYFNNLKNLFLLYRLDYIHNNNIKYITNEEKYITNEKKNITNEKKSYAKIHEDYMKNLEELVQKSKKLYDLYKNNQIFNAINNIIQNIDVVLDLQMSYNLIDLINARDKFLLQMNDENYNIMNYLFKKFNDNLFDGDIFIYNVKNIDFKKLIEEYVENNKTLIIQNIKDVNLLYIIEKFYLITIENIKKRAMKSTIYIYLK